MNEESEITAEGNSRLDALRHQIAQRRWREEVKGVEHNGARFRGDSDGRQAVTEAAQFAEMFEAGNGAGTFQVDWKSIDGQWAEGVTRDDLVSIMQKLGQRRQACFAREKELIAQAKADPDGFDQTLIGTGWPV